MRNTVLPLVVLALSISSNLFSQAQPGFTTKVISSQWNQAVGLTFNHAGNVMFVWERTGKVWTVENEIKTLTLDISEEVGGYGDLGLLGFSLDPMFTSNGYMYLLYTVDRHHLLSYGTSSYSSTTSYNYNATIQRVTRYTAIKNSSGYTVDRSTRKILIGQTRQTGIPSVAPVHGPGSLLFGTDGTLLISSGDGAGASGVDTGNATGTYYSLALSNGIITPAENVGAFRAQLLESYCGKILRIDPATGNGVSSNPFFDPANPNSPRSKVWSLGVRNGFRMSLVPGTGSTNPADGNPGAIYVGDVGHVTWEEIDLVDKPGMNLGWPLFEGLTTHSGYSTRNVFNMNAPNPSYGTSGCTRRYFYFRELIKQATASGSVSFTNPCNTQPIGSSIKTFVHTRPLVDWGHATTSPSRCGTFTSGGLAATINIGASGAPVSGPQFNGKCAVGGIFYPYDDFPIGYKNAYIFADYTRRWMRSMTVDTYNKPKAVGNIIDTGSVVAMAINPAHGGIYFIDFTSTIKKVTYNSDNKPPVAVAKTDVQYGLSPLTVKFNGSSSYDPEGEQLKYVWNFGDGTSSVEINPTKTFTTESSGSTKYLVTLSVSDQSGISGRDSLYITLNNEPPVVSITSPVQGDRYAMNGQLTLNLRSTATDKEDSVENLAFEWTVVLHHDDHQHPEPPITTRDASATTSPLGCGTESYFYRIMLKVTDRAGMSTTKSVDVHPYCDKVVSFTLVNADTDKDIQTIINGATIDLRKLGIRMINIRANTSPAIVYGVQFNLSGHRTRDVSDRSAPYTLYGDVGGDYVGWDAPAGSYTLKGTPYTSKGVRGVELNVGFRLVKKSVSSAAVIAESDSTHRKKDEFAVRLYPSPFNHQFTLELTNSEKMADIIISDVYGQKLLRTGSTSATKKFTLGNQLPAGIYIVTIKSGFNIKTLKVVKTN